MKSSCIVEKCHRKHHGNGFCMYHYDNVRSLGVPVPPNILCVLCGQDTGTTRKDRKFCDECRSKKDNLRGERRPIGPCDICKDVVSLCLDHDHRCCDKPVGHRKSQRYYCGNCDRGWLCRKCNTAIGLLKDDPLVIVAALEYLETWQLTEG